jgi:DNA-binding HxlR family transcriptional regulator
MVLLDALGRRWALRVLWELRDDRALTFRALQDACGGVSPTVLNTRVRELVDLRLVETAETGYRLTPAGRELGALLLPIHAFAERWARAR